VRLALGADPSFRYLAPVDQDGVPSPGKPLRQMDADQRGGDESVVAAEDGCRTVEERRKVGSMSMVVSLPRT
jgi:hypothetical protein